MHWRYVDPCLFKLYCILIQGMNKQERIWVHPSIQEHSRCLFGRAMTWIGKMVAQDKIIRKRMEVYIEGMKFFLLIHAEVFPYPSNMHTHLAHR